MVTYRATLDVATELILTVSRLRADERRRRGTRKGTRALTCYKQTVLMVPHFREATSAEALARDNAISRATAYRYIDEGIAVLSDQTPDLEEVLQDAHARGESVILDKKLFTFDRCREPKPDNGDGDLWYSGHKRRHGALIAFLSNSAGDPLWVSAGEPGSVFDITAARTHVLPVLRPVTATGLVALADLGYEGAGAGVMVPVKRPGHVREDRFSADNKAYNLLLCGMRAIGERAMAVLVGRWRLLRHTTKSPSRIGDIVKAALVLTKLEHQTP